MAAYSPRRARLTGGQPVGRLIRTVERHYRQDLPAGVVCGGCNHLLVALRRPDCAFDLAVSGELRDGHGRHYERRRLGLLPTRLVVARPGRADRRRGLRCAFLLALPWRTIRAALDTLARPCVHRFYGLQGCLSWVLLWFARLGDGFGVGVYRVHSEPALVPDPSLPQGLI